MIAISRHQIVKDLLSKCQRQRIRGEATHFLVFGEECVVITFAVTESFALFRECDARNDNQVDAT